MINDPCIMIYIEVMVGSIDCVLHCKDEVEQSGTKVNFHPPTIGIVSLKAQNKNHYYKGISIMEKKYRKNHTK